MFDRQAYLLESLRTLSTFTGETKTGSRLKDEPYAVTKNFAHSYAVYQRQFPDRVSQIDSGPRLEEMQEIDEGINQNDVNWHALREDLLNVLEKHGLTRPDDPAEDPHFYLVDDRYNEERYHYTEVYKPSVLTLNWLKDTTDVLQEYSGWGVGVTNLREGYLLVFAERLLVTGPAFRRCDDVPSVLEAAKQLI